MNKTTTVKLTETQRKRASAKARGVNTRSNWIQPWRRLAVYIRDEFACAYCGTALNDAKPADITLDHLVCQINGGSHDASNLVTACRSCNSARGKKLWRDYATGGSILNINKLVRRKLNAVLAKSIIKGRKTTSVENRRA